MTPDWPIEPAKERTVMRHNFMGLNADEWEETGGNDGALPASPITGGRLTVQDVRAGVVAMLRRLDEETT